MTRRVFLIRAVQGIAAAAVVGTGAAILPAATPAAAGMSLAMKLLRAEAWAKSQVGSKAWGTGSNTFCERFAENAYGTSGRYPTAIAAFRSIGRSGNPTSRGQMVFFAANRSNGNAGHVGIFIGSDQFVSVTTTGVRIASVSAWSRTVAALVGYANPPDSWPGR